MNFFNNVNNTTFKVIHLNNYEYNNSNVYIFNDILTEDEENKYSGEILKLYLILKYSTMIKFL